MTKSTFSVRRSKLKQRIETVLFVSMVENSAFETLYENNTAYAYIYIYIYMYMYMYIKRLYTRNLVVTMILHVDNTIRKKYKQHMI